MNWKRIGFFSVVGAVATIVVGFCLGFVNSFLVQMGGEGLAMKPLMTLGSWLAVSAVFVAFAYEQRERLIEHGCALVFGVWLINLPLSLLTGQSILKWLISIFACFVFGGLGLGIGALLRRGKPGPARA